MSSDSGVGMAVGRTAAADEHRRDARVADELRVPKFSPPVLSGAFVRRTHLCDLLEQASARRLTIVTAGPGYGKSSLLAGWASETGGVWYTLDDADRSLVTFARGLSESLRERLPELPAEVAGGLAVSTTSAAGQRAHAESLASLVCERLELLNDSTVLVLDDVQEIELGSASARLLETLCRQAPTRFHLVLASRLAPPFAVERLRGQGQVTTFGPAALSFTEQEVAQILAAELEQEDLVEPVHTLTAGWPAGVRLTVETLRGVSPADRRRVLEGVHRPGGSLFRYLAEEVFAAEPEGVRELLRVAAHFERVTPALCADLGVRGAAQKLLGLAERGFFVQAEAGEEQSFVVHALVREFIRNRWPLAPARERSLHRRAARWFEARGMVDAALRSATAGGDREELSRLLVEHASELLARGSIDEIDAAAALLPAEERPQRIDEVVGEAHALRGRWDDALACYERALHGESGYPPRLAWRIGRIHFDRGHPEDALDVYARSRVDGSEPVEEAQLLAGIAAAELSRGRLERGAAAAARALGAATASNDPRALAAAHNISMVVAIRAQPGAAAEHFRLGLEAANRAGDALQTIRLRSNYVAYLIEQGSFDLARAELEPALRLAELAGAPLALAFALLKRGEVRFHVGEVDLAIADFEDARSLYARMGSNRAFGALMELGEVYRERGDSALARLTLEQACRGAEEAADAQVLGYAMANLARATGNDDGQRATALAERAVELCRESGHDLVFALLSSGWVALVCGRRRGAAEHAVEAAANARERGDRAGLAEALELQAMSAADPAHEVGRIEEAITIWQTIGNTLHEAKARLALARLAGDAHGEEVATQRLQRLGAREAGPPAGLLASLPAADPSPVAIRTLGGFALLRHGETVPASEWQSKKARDLLKLLVARRGRPTPRDMLAEALWPEDDPDKTANRLSVALSTVRTVLDPDRRYAPDHFIVADKEAVALQLSHASVDIENFLADARSGIAQLGTAHHAHAHGLLESAEIAYRGDFLEEDLYEDWATPLREEARTAYIAVARALADEAAAAGDDDTAIRYRLRVLERDPYDERAHLELVAVLTEAKRHGEARRAYQTYTARMEHIGVEPAPMPA